MRGNRVVRLPFDEQKLEPRTKMKDSDRMKNALLLLLWACAAFAFGDDDADLQARIDAARARLDDAARELAQLHKQDTFQIELPNPEERVSLGVLLAPGGKRGVTIAGVTPDGAAAEAGVRAGDVIVAINGVSLRDAGSKQPMMRLFDALKDVSPGDVVRTDVERNGDLRSVDISAREPGPEPVAGFAVSTMAFNPGPGTPPAISARAMIGGLELFQLNEGLGHYFGVSEGVLVLSAPPDNDGGPVAGDVVRGVDGKPVISLADLINAVGSRSGDVPVEVQRDGAAVTVHVRSEAFPPVGLPPLHPGRSVDVIRMNTDRKVIHGEAGTVVNTVEDE
jgi:C-terminal processing protease CtpA/Prc